MALMGKEAGACCCKDNIQPGAGNCEQMLPEASQNNFNVSLRIDGAVFSFLFFLWTSTMPQL